jgi:hypothetical protein
VLSLKSTTITPLSLYGTNLPFFGTSIPAISIFILQFCDAFRPQKKITMRLSHLTIFTVILLAGSLSTLDSTAQGKITFSNSINGSSKQKFKTSEYIYGKMELPSSLKEFFGTDNADNNNQYPKSYLILDVVVVDEEDNELGSISKQYLKPSESELKGHSYNFDVYPEPSKASTTISMIAPFTIGVSVPFYSLFDQSASYGRAPSYTEGKAYKVKVSISRWKLDQTNSYWMGTYSACSGEFMMEYHAADMPKITKGGKEAKDLVAQNSKKKETEDRGLPKEWNLKSASIGSGETEGELKKIFLSQEPKLTEVIKVVALPAEGGWVVYTDEKVAYKKILFRWFNQTLVFFYKREGKYYCAKGGVRQDYAGDTNYGKSYLKWEEKFEVASRYMEAAMR